MQYVLNKKRYMLTNAYFFIAIYLKQSAGLFCLQEAEIITDCKEALAL